MELFLYGISIFSAIGIFLVSNPISAVVCLLGVFFTGAFVFVVHGVEYFGVLLLTIYVGALAVLFLFIVMMVNLSRFEYDRTVYMLIGMFIIMLVVGQGFVLSVYALGTYTPTAFIYDTDSFSYLFDNYTDEVARQSVIRDIGYILCVIHPIFVLSAGVLLFVSTVGVVFLTGVRRGYAAQRQYNQLERTRYIYLSYLY